MNQPDLYKNPLGKTRLAEDAEITHKISQERLDFFEQTIRPEVLGTLKQQGLEVELEVVGSTATFSATENSDVDVKIRILTPGKDERIVLARVRDVLAKLREKYQLNYPFNSFGSGLAAGLQVDMQALQMAAKRK